MPICLASSGSSTEIILENRTKHLIESFAVYNNSMEMYFVVIFFLLTVKITGYIQPTNTLASTGITSTSDRGIISSLGSQCIY